MRRLTPQVIAAGMVAICVLLSWVGYELRTRNALLKQVVERSRLEEPMPGTGGGLLDFYSEQIREDIIREERAREAREKAK